MINCDNIRLYVVERTVVGCTPFMRIDLNNVNRAVPFYPSSCKITPRRIRQVAGITNYLNRV